MTRAHDRPSVWPTNPSVPVDRTAFLLRVPADMAVALADRSYSLGMSRQAYVRSVLAAALANSGSTTCGVECRLMTEAYGVVNQQNDTC